MNNILDYISWRGDLSFNRDEFNEVDNLIFANLVYLQYDAFVPPFKSDEQKSLHRVTKELFKGNDPKLFRSGLMLGPESAIMAFDMAKHHRYKHVKLCHFINIINDEMQFSATAFVLNSNLIYISFKGTDDSLMGWEEDFKMTYQFPVPAQSEAIEYTKQIMEEFPDHDFILGGHSKGGNIAVFVAAMLPKKYQDRIHHVYSNDGPGFVPGAINPKLIKEITHKCTLIIPNESIVGHIFENYIDDVRIVHSNKRGINQHDSFSWEVKGKNFVASKSLTQKSNAASKEIDELIYNLSLEEREKLGNDIGTFMKATKVKTLTELSKNPIVALSTIHAFRAKNRKVLDKFISIFIRNGLL